MISTRLKFLVVALLYFSEGLPFGLVNNLLSVYFRVKKISLEEIGLLSLLGLAWSIKIFWAPLVDRYGQRYSWIFPTQLLIALGSILLAFLNPISQKALFWLVLAGICLSSATQDIAVDAYTIDLLEEQELGPANGIRSASYRVALVTSGGLLVMMSDWIGWLSTFIIAGVIMFFLALLVVSLSIFHVPRKAINIPFRAQYIYPLSILFQKPNFWLAIFFIAFFKVGEAMLVAMANPFWIDRGFSPTEIGLVVGTLGTLAGIGGALAGGFLTARWGIIKALWILGIFQATASLGYLFSALPAAPNFAIYLAALLESLAIGLATSAFLSFLMQLCDKRFSATHYAFLSILFGLGRSGAGVASGYLANLCGYPTFFFLTFLLGLIPLPLLLYLKPTLSGSPKKV
ncbi:MAG: MFS transporter [Thermodesulfobacteriota bacterium]